MILRKPLKGVIMFDHKLTVPVVLKQDTTDANFPKGPTVLPLKWLTHKPVLIDQWSMMKEKLHVQE